MSNADVFDLGTQFEDVLHRRSFDSRKVLLFLSLLCFRPINGVDVDASLIRTMVDQEEGDSAQVARRESAASWGEVSSFHPPSRLY